MESTLIILLHFFAATMTSFSRLKRCFITPLHQLWQNEPRVYTKEIQDLQICNLMSGAEELLNYL